MSPHPPVNIPDYATEIYIIHFLEPQITDYNIKLMSGIQSINVTWSIVSVKTKNNIVNFESVRIIVFN